MKIITKNLLLLPLLLSLFTFTQDVEVATEPSDIDKLLDLVEENTLLRSKSNQERLDQFIKNSVITRRPWSFIKRVLR